MYVPLLILDLCIGKKRPTTEWKHQKWPSIKDDDAALPGQQVNASQHNRGSRDRYKKYQTLGTDISPEKARLSQGFFLSKRSDMLLSGKPT